MLPVLSRLADLLGELAVAAVQRRLALLVELAGGQLEQVGLASRFARLPDEPHALVVMGDDPDRPRVATHWRVDSWPSS